MRRHKALLLFTVLFTMICAAGVHAEGFSDYYDYMNPDGSYSYYFTQGIKVTMDEEWYQNTFVVPEEAGVTFYHKDSYDKYQEDGISGGGRLFRIGASVNTSFQDLPDFDFIGFDEETVMNYYVEYPTDYPAYTADEAVRAEYDALWASVKDVTAGIELVNDTEAEPQQTQEPAPEPATDDITESADFDQEPSLSGGWTLTEELTVTEEAQKAFDQAMEGLYALEYDPVALLATQVVSGTNYCFLCKKTPAALGKDPSYSYVYVYADLNGGAELLQVQGVSLGVVSLDGNGLA